jgi:hypothetical protein
MRADYATSDLISKVNSDWLKQVLANPEFGRAGPRDDIAEDHIPGDHAPPDHVDGDHGPEDVGVVSDLRLRREFARKRRILLQRGSTGADRRGPDITVEPMARPSRRRSVARRVKERLALAVAALAVVWVALWMALEAPDVANSDAMGATTASIEPAAPVSTNELQPAWLLPEILYGPAMARSPAPREVPRPVPKTGR